MSGPCPTLDSLIALGFEHRESKYGAETVGYRFVHGDLEAVHVMNLSARYVVLLSGVLNTGRRLSTIESQIPNDLESALETAAWVSYALESHRSELEPLPDWYVKGERHWDLVPPGTRSTRVPGKAEGLRGQPKVLYRQGLCPTPSA